MTLSNWTRRARKVALATFQRGRRWVHREVSSWTGQVMKSAAGLGAVDRFVQKSVRRAFGIAESRLGPITVLALVAVVVLSIMFRDWLQAGPDGLESGSTTLRNLGLVIAGAIALPIAIWRSRVAQIQANTAQRELSNRLYQQGTEMLQSAALSVRLDGIYTLERLAKDEPERYHIQIMSRLCGLARHQTRDDGVEARSDTKREPRLREDVQAVVAAISSCHARQDRLEMAADFRLNLRGVDFPGARLFKARLSRANLSMANLAGANLIGADLAGAEFSRANLAGATLSGADLARAGFDRAELPEARLDSANLAKARLSSANLFRARLSNANLAEAHLSNANLAGASLHESDLSRTRLQGGNLAGASLPQANLSGAILSRANLAGALLSGANLTGSDLSNANLSNANLSPLTVITQEVDKDEYRQTVRAQLTQAQLDVARADPRKPPKLDGAIDAETGKPLVWRGKPLDENA